MGESLINDSDEELYGDFEDLEADEKEGDDDDGDDESDSEDDDEMEDEEDAKMKRLKQKEALKAKFNAEYDDDDSNAVDYLEELKEEVDKQKKINEEDTDAMEKLKEKFSTVNWFEDVDESLINDSDEELYGDFEDLEADEKEGDDDDDGDDESDSEDDDDEMEDE